MSGATYWTMVFGDLLPTPETAGIILAKYDELVGRLQHLSTDPVLADKLPPVYPDERSS